MQVIRYLSHHHARAPSVICMGNYDGVHLGHQSIIKQVVNLAKQHQYLSTVILFEPHPKEFFMGNKAPSRLMRLSDKLVMLEKLGVDQVVILKFNANLASIPATQFVKKVLLETLRMKMMVMNAEGRFGHQRQGDIHLLQQLALAHGYQVIEADDYTHQQNRISSTLIRQALAEGDCEKAQQYLGHPYTMTGRIIYGNQLGRTLGFPTINIACLRKSVALSGIFVAMVQIEGFDQPLRGVAHIARRSIVDDLHPILEVHLFDFNADVYGKRATVSFISKLRNTKEVKDLDSLKELIQIDAAAAQNYFNQH